MANLSSTLSSDTSWGGTRLGAHLSTETYQGSPLGSTAGSSTFPPAGAARIWGCDCSTGSFLVDSTRTRELTDMVAVGCTTVRFDGSVTAATVNAVSGFTSKIMRIWDATLAGMAATAANPASVVTYVNANGGPTRIILEPINEPNFMGSTVADVAVKQRNWYRAVKAVLPTVEITLSSVGNSTSSDGKSMMQWCQGLVDNGCVYLDGFDNANYHTYNDQAFWHIWTPDGAGHSCQTILGNPPFYVTEFGQALSGVSSNETTQATRILSMMTDIKTQSLCMGAWQYALSDDAPGTGTGYGLRRHDLSHRPSWDTFLNNKG